ncbi:MAG: DEAD/DEAH box helicase [Oscillospiraceae bacterium]|nr:DEAD/DEAH box helicase [Oscillospiraceae bacterium]
MPELRNYQEDLIRKTQKSWRTGHKAPCIVLPCGGGKSVVVAEISKRTTRNKRQVLFLVHRKELCEQILRTFSWWGVDMSLCDVMMVQTASRRLERLHPPNLIITDENHHSKASTYRKIYEKFPKAYRVGVTATPVRLDGSGLMDVNDDLITGVSAKWLIQNQHLAPYTYYAPDFIDLSGIKVNRGEYDTKSAEMVMDKPKIHGNIIKYYQKFARNQKAVCYCVSVRHSMKMAEIFKENGIPAAHVDGETPKDQRSQIIDDFRKGKIKILCNVDLISEGFDVPDCGCVIMLRPTKSLTLYIQQSMRCMRYRLNKKAVILDHVGNYARFGMPDDDREWTLAGKPKKNGNQEEKEISALQCKECFAVFQLKPGQTPVICPYCGYQFPVKIVQRKELEADETAEIKKIEGFHFDIKPLSACSSYAELLEYAQKHGYKKGWAWYQAKERGFLT